MRPTPEARTREHWSVEACQAVGAAIGGIANGLNPDVIVITGGIVKSLARYEDRILEHAAEYGFAATLADARIHFVPGYKNQTSGGAARLTSARGERPGSPEPWRHPMSYT